MAELDLSKAEEHAATTVYDRTQLVQADAEELAADIIWDALPHILDALAEQAAAESDAQPHWVAPRIAAGWIRAKAEELRA